MSESKNFEELFGSVYVWTFFRNMGRGFLNSKLVEELFCLCLDNFSGRGHVPLQALGLLLPVLELL